MSALPAYVQPCDRCHDVPATTHQEHRHAGDPAHWDPTRTDRCDKCAQDLRDYAALGGISVEIVVDRPLRKP